MVLDLFFERETEIDGTLLCLVIDFQKVVLAPKSKWIKAIKEVNINEDKRHLHDQLFRLIGKLQSYENENTKEILIPDEFKISKAIHDVNWFRNDNHETFNEENKKILIEILEDLVGEEHVDGELERLLRIDGVNDNLEAALPYTKDAALHYF